MHLFRLVPQRWWQVSSAFPGEPSPRVMQRLNEMRARWVRFIANRFLAQPSPTDPAWASKIVHGYFHGELCKLIDRHAFVPKSANDRDRIVNNTLALIDLVGTADDSSLPSSPFQPV